MPKNSLLMTRTALGVFLFVLAFVAVPARAQVPPFDIPEIDHCCFWKADYRCDYAPSGMPDFDQKRTGWECPVGQFSWCGPTASADCVWWFDSKYDYLNDLATLPLGCISPPAINDLYTLVTSYGTWDDHDMLNAIPLIRALAMCMDTDGISSGGAHCGTIFPDLVNCLTNWFAVNPPPDDPFCVEARIDPCWEIIERWVRCSEDVILLLGFYWQDPTGEWHRCGGHYVTIAGLCVDYPSAGTVDRSLCISDPYFDRTEAGMTFGRVRNGILGPNAPIPHAGAPGIHDDAGNISHDCYPVDEGRFADHACLALPSYAFDCIDILNFCGQNPQFPGEILEPCTNFPVQVVIDAAVRISPKSLKTDIEIVETTAVTKSQLTFDVCYKNASCETLGDDEVLTPELHLMLFNAKVTGDYSALLTAIPVLSPGATWCDPGFQVTVPKTSIKKIQKILNSNIRARTRVKINGVVDLNSQDWKPFKITECSTTMTFPVNQNDENQDVDPTDGFGGIDPFEGEPDGTNNTGNEGFFALTVPNLATDMIGTRLVIPTNTPWTVSMAEFSAADFGVPGPGASVGLFRSDPLGNCDMAAPVFGPFPVGPMLANSVSGGDHWNTLAFPAAAVAGGEVLHMAYFFGPGLNHGLGIDNYLGVKGEPNAVNYERSYLSIDGDCIEDCPLPGNWIVKLHVNCPPAPVPGERVRLNLKSFLVWSDTVVFQWRR